MANANLRDRGELIRDIITDRLRPMIRIGSPVPCVASWIGISRTAARFHRDLVLADLGAEVVTRGRRVVVVRVDDPI